MLIIAGDSHSRQFQREAPGAWGFFSFSGATIKGLFSATSLLRHGETIKHLAAAPFQKQMFVMLGGVDLDVTFYRNLAFGRMGDERAFFEERAAIYSRYIEFLLWAAGDHVEHICVLAPQLTPLRDEVFVGATARMAKIDEEDLRRVGRNVDCSHRARCIRQRVFNDTLQGAFTASEKMSFHRIDNDMTSDGELIADAFCRRNEWDHHADPKATLPLWEDRLQDHVPRFKKAVRRRAATGA